MARMNTEDTLNLARQVLQAEADAVGSLRVDDAFAQAAQLLAQTAREGGAVVVSGMGKSGLIGQKLSATLASVGVPSHFLHPSEAFHGDLGRVRRGDGVILISFGGGTEEVVSLAEVLRQDAVPMVALTRTHDSALGRLATHCLALGAMEEACPHNLAPTASTTATLAMGDALALCASRLLNFGAEDFYRFHPSGGLGKQMMPVAEAMRFKVGENLPVVDEATSIQDAYAHVKAEADAAGLRRAGALLAVDKDGKLAGIFTDGDLRRLVTEGRADLSRPLSEVITRSPRTLQVDQRVRDAVHIVRELRIDEVPVLDKDGKPVGLIDIQDLVTLKVIEG